MKEPLNEQFIKMQKVAGIKINEEMKKKQMYTVECSWTVWGTAKVEAESPEQAKKIVEGDNFPLPDQKDEYDTASFSVDMIEDEQGNEIWEKKKD